MSQEKIDRLLIEASKHLKPEKFFWIKINEPKVENARECYEKIANILKFEKRWDEAAKMYEKAASLEPKINIHSVPYLYISAFECYKNVGNEEMAELNLENSVISFAENGNFHKAAIQRVKLAENEESKQQPNFNKIIQNYFESITYDSNSFHNIKCYSKIIQIYIKMEKYEEAIKNYQEYFLILMKEKTLQYRIIKDFLTCILCYLCNDDLIGAKKNFEKFSDHPNFSFSREYELCENLIKCMETFDLDLFNNCIKKYDNITPFDDEKISLLIKIKRFLEEDLC